MEKKTIELDPSLLIASGSGGTKAQKAHKQKRNTAKKAQLVQVKGDSVKDLLLRKLKEYKKNKSKKANIPSNPTKQIHPDFMEKLRKKRNKSEQHVFMDHFQDSIPSNVVHINQPIVTPPPMTPMTPMNPMPSIPPKPQLSQVIPINDPPYSNLKYTSKPTYRQWLNLSTPPQEEQIQSEKPKDTRIEIETKTKFKVGKNKTMKRVGIFLKSNNLRRSVEDSKTKWKKTNLKTVKSYLKKNNLIRYGTTAPNELIRELYETTQMCGGVKNKNGKVLVDNFLNEPES